MLRGEPFRGGVRPPPWEARPGASRDLMAARLSSELEAKTRMASLEAELNMMRSRDATPRLGRGAGEAPGECG